MLLQKLRCFHFKNYEEAVFHFASQLNCIVGLNGAGKTNLLDAIHYLSLTKSAFNTIDQQNIQQGQHVMGLQGVFLKENTTYNLQCKVARDAGKIFQVNGKAYSKLRMHLGRFPLVLTTPYDIDLVQGSSDVRRKFFDALLCQMDATYLNYLSQYQRVLKQRNSCLKLYTIPTPTNKTWISAYDDQLLALNVHLYRKRKKFIDQFVPILVEHYRYVVRASENIELEYCSEIDHSGFQQRFLANFTKDWAAQRTTMGVHRDEFDFKLNGYSLKKFGSQGQKKSFCIALRLSQFVCLEKALSCKPLLLLDDMFDKLDTLRIEQLLDLVNQKYFGQVWITDAGGARSNHIFKKIRAEKALFTIQSGKMVGSALEA